MITFEQLLEKENLRNTPLDVFISLKDNIDDIEILNEICSHIDFENHNTFYTSLKRFLLSYGKKLSLIDNVSVVKEIGESNFNKSVYSEKIISAFNRPVLLIRNDRIESSIDTIWKKRIDDSEVSINTSIPSVGRIEIQNHPRYKWVGTGWLIRGTNIIVTNRHVAMIFSSRQQDSFDVNLNHKGKTLQVSIDFKEEYNVDDENTFKVKKVLHIAENDEPDIALLEIFDRSYDGKPLPEGLEIAQFEPNSRDDVFVLGYPAKNSMYVNNFFKDIYDVKRLAPGKIYPSSAASFIYRHDCSTWHGNSGSPIIELTTGKVVGIHYGGSDEDFDGNKGNNWAVRSTYLLELLEELKISYS